MEPLQQIARFFRKANGDLHLLKDDYFLLGSAAIALAGCPIDTIGDINILTSNSDADLLKTKWASRIITGHMYSYERIFRSNSARFNFDHIQVEIMGNLEVKVSRQWIPLIVRQYNSVTVAGYPVKVPTLKEQHRIYKFFGRPKDSQKARLLEQYI